MNKRFAMLRLPCSALRILKRLQHNVGSITSFCERSITIILIVTKNRKPTLSILSPQY
ncbi:MAG: hypothetical protein LBH59_04975 [Planctomycetaceae bacterium]|nr:hypothetical protein [Planctomycetaceae bacterium]